MDGANSILNTVSTIDDALNQIEKSQNRALSPGISFIIRCQNEADNLRACLLSIVDLADEIIIVDNLSTDNSWQIMSDLAMVWPNIKVYRYQIKIPRPNQEHIAMVTTNNRNTIATYYNWCLSKATKYNVFKWDGDFIAIRKNLIDMIDLYQLRIREDRFALWFTGKTLFNGHYIRNGPDYYDEFRAFSLKNGFKWFDGFKCEYVEPYQKECHRLFINSEKISNIKAKNFNLYHDYWKPFKHQSKPIFLEQKNITDFKPGASTIDIRDTEDNNILMALENGETPSLVMNIKDHKYLGHQLESEMVICTVNYEIFGGAERLAYILALEQINKGKHVFFWDYENKSPVNEKILLTRLRLFDVNVKPTHFTYLQLPVEKLLPFVHNKGLHIVINNCLLYHWYWTKYLLSNPDFKFTAISHNHRGWVVDYLDKFQNQIDQVWTVNHLTMTAFANKSYFDRCHLLNLYGVLPNKGKLLKNKNMDQTKPIILYINRFSIEKGVIIVPYVLKHLKPVFPDLKLYVVGYGDKFSQLLEQFDRLNVSSMVQVEGYQEDTSPYLEKANFLLFPSLCTEGRPFVIIDALAHGVEVIATETEPLKEIVDDDSLVDISIYFDLQNNTILSMDDYPTSIYQNADKLGKLYADKVLSNYSKGFDLDLVESRFEKSKEGWGRLGSHF